MDNKEIRVAIPKIEISINMSYMEYVKTLFAFIKDFQKRLFDLNKNNTY